ncbi:CHASE4 domain-containing protein [Leptolyngbya sp. 'hensonii']|uniref:CHASE4 domain-containing protein n=1 Tax=Leptolyngbya sp. 'hensonii' TaxID=1922337 RepID=UPI000A8A39D2|nr:CHASE4 domain-containing protein [Leptolyngbya sp. 'hensonii']
MQHSLAQIESGEIDQNRSKQLQKPQGSMPFNPLNSFKQLTLYQKTLLILSVTLSGLVGGLYLGSLTILSESLKQAEQQSATQTIQGVLSVLGQDKKAFAARYSDWSAWDDTYAFIQNRDESYIKSNLVPGQFTNLKVNLILFIDTKNRIVFGSGFDLKKKQLLPVPQGLQQRLVATDPLIQASQTRQATLTGIVVLPEGPMLLTAQPILTSEGKGPVRGTAIFGRYLDSKSITDLSQATQLSLSAYPANHPNLPLDFQTVQPRLSPESPIAIAPLSEKSLGGYVLLPDIYQQSGLLLRIEIPRTIYQQSRRSQQELILTIAIVGVVFGGVTLLLLERLVLSRLGRLSQGVRKIRASQDLSLRLSLPGNDELSVLARDMNGLLENLDLSQNALQRNLTHLAEVNQDLQMTMQCLQREIKERQQAESALQQSEQQLVARTAQLEATLQDLQQAQMQLIQSEKMSGLGQLVAGVAHEINNPVNFIRGNISYANRYLKDLLDLLHLYRSQPSLSTPEIQAREEEIDLEFLLEDLSRLFSSMQVGVNRINDIVRSLRTFSRLDEAAVKTVDLHEGMDSTLMILQHRLKANADSAAIKVVKDYGDLPPIECYAGQLNQVFMNILANAIDALEEQEQRLQQQPIPLPLTEDNTWNKQIRIGTELADSRTVRIRIADNGPGMDETVRQRMFDPFFTTKAIGKGTGMGMSISYQVIVEKHRGRLHCASVLGQGTEFIIEIPIAVTST